MTLLTMTSVTMMLVTMTLLTITLLTMMFLTMTLLTMPSRYLHSCDVTYNALTLLTMDLNDEALADGRTHPIAGNAEERSHFGPLDVGEYQNVAVVRLKNCNN